MKIAAVICEYNPIHLGHAYHIERTRELTGCDYVLGIMSAEFVQRGEYALLPASLRAQTALLSGCDIVLALPAAYSLAPAMEFARGAIRLLNAFPNITTLSFGTECGNLETLKKLADAAINESNVLSERIVMLQRTEGMSYPRAQSSAYKALGIENSELLNMPNNILAIEYLKALSILNSHIQPLAIKREGADYNSKTLAKSSFASSTALREAIRNKELHKTQEYLPRDVWELLNDKDKVHWLFDDSFFSETDKRIFTLLRYRLIESTPSELRKIYGVSEGLEYSLRTAAQDAKSLEEFFGLLKSKRYTMARLKRISFCVLLGLKKEIPSTYNSMVDGKSVLPYFRILGIRNTASILLKHLPIYSLLKHSDLSSINLSHTDMLNIDKRSVELYNTILNLQHVPYLCEKLVKV